MVQMLNDGLFQNKKSINSTVVISTFNIVNQFPKYSGGVNFKRTGFPIKKYYSQFSTTESLIKELNLSAHHTNKKLISF